MNEIRLNTRIATVDIDGETKIIFPDKYNSIIVRTDSEIGISPLPNKNIGDENVLRCKANESTVYAGVYNTYIYLIGSGKIEIILGNNFNLNPFKVVGGSGGGGGSTPVLISKTITENGTYNANEDNADGYSKVDVNVQATSEFDIYLSKNSPINLVGDNNDIYVECIENGVEWVCGSSYFVYDANTILWEQDSQTTVKKSNGTAIAVCLRFSSMGYNDGLAALLSTVKNNVDMLYMGSSSASTYETNIDGITWYFQRSVAGSTQAAVPYPVFTVPYSRSDFESSESIRAEIIPQILEAAHVEQSLKGNAKIYKKENNIWVEIAPIEI